MTNLIFTLNMIINVNSKKLKVKTIHSAHIRYFLADQKLITLMRAMCVPSFLLCLPQVKYLILLRESFLGCHTVSLAY